MKNKLEHIDHLFLDDAADNASDFSTKKGWRTLKVKLLLSEIKAFNFTNVNRTYLLIAGLLLLLFSSSVIYYRTTGNQNLELTETAIPIVSSPLTEENFHFPADETAQRTGSRLTDNQPDQQITAVHSSAAHKNEQGVRGIEQQQFASNQKPAFERSSAQTSKIKKIKSKKLSTDFGLKAKSSAPIFSKTRTASNIEAESFYVPEEQTNPTPQFLLGLNAGFVFPLNESVSTENIYQPVWMAGINFRYNRKHFFIETALAFSYFESDLNTTYRYDSLLGVITSSSYEIIETVNEAGETVLERQYTSELTPVYDTISSSDQVTIHAHSTLLHIPLRVGFPVFRSGNFYTAIYAGAVFRLLIARNQNAPQYGANKQPIIDYETNPVINYSPELYFQGGLLLGYDVSRSLSFEIYSSYNHLLGGNSTYIPAANIQAGFGIHFKF
jgi:hypothetical protein